MCQITQIALLYYPVSSYMPLDLKGGHCRCEGSGAEEREQIALTLQSFLFSCIRTNGWDQSGIFSFQSECVIHIYITRGVVVYCFSFSHAVRVICDPVYCYSRSHIYDACESFSEWRFRIDSIQRLCKMRLLLYFIATCGQ